MKPVLKIAMGAKPDPYKYHIKSWKVVGGNTIILAQYEGCKTFNGDKLMVLRGIHHIEDGEPLDPHFLDEEHAVIARFIPTEDGWNMAKTVASYMCPVNYKCEPPNPCPDARRAKAFGQILWVTWISTLLLLLYLWFTTP